MSVQKYIQKPTMDKRLSVGYSSKVTIHLTVLFVTFNGRAEIAPFSTKLVFSAAQKGAVIKFLSTVRNES